MSDTKPETFKVVLLGDRKTGKSMFRDVYCTGKNQDTDCSTLEVESIKKEVKLKGNITRRYLVSKLLVSRFRCDYQN